MGIRCILGLSCLTALLSLSLPAVSGNEAGSATLKASLRFPAERSDDDQLKEESSNIDQISSPTNHATSSSSYTLISNLGSSFNNNQRDDDKSGYNAYSPFILTADSPLRATTYGPPSPVDMKYRMRIPQNPHYNTDIQQNTHHRFRGVHIPPNKQLDFTQNYKINPGLVDPIHKYPQPLQHDLSSYRKYYKKPQEIPLVRKTTPRPKSNAFYHDDDYITTNYEESFSKQKFNNDFKKQLKDHSEEEEEHPFKTSSETDGFGKSFFDNLYSGPQSNGKESYRDIYYHPATPKPSPKPAPAPAPLRSLSKYYKKPINHFQNKQSIEYKIPGRIFPDQVDYPRPVYKSSEFTASASSSSGEWTPINAPQGAVPAKSYDIPAPDLSQDKRNTNNYKRNIYEDSLRHDVVFGTNKFRKGVGNSEEVVSAVVMVKQR
ncbi:uncharacterized protein LOC142320882 [Lycorma delicatula]|uniref:uncharacterized protein LOC142320882 n=1 Tax=Lycorma delicatula TaxID=130591 RepID=UPI003F5191D6